MSVVLVSVEKGFPTADFGVLFVGGVTSLVGDFCSSAKVVSPRLFNNRLSALRYTLFDEELTTVVAI